MKSISVKDLRNKPVQIQKKLHEEKENTINSKDKPVSAVFHMQEQSLKSRNNRMKLYEINKEIKEERKKQFNKCK